MGWTSKRKSYMTVLDIGTSKICCLVLRMNADQKPEVIGMGYAPSKGIKNGVIVDLDKATDCIRSVLEQAEQQSERSIDKVIVNISASQMRSVQYYEEMEISDGRQIVASDVKRLVDGSIAKYIQAGEEVLHSFPLSYVVNSEQGVEPRGMYGPKLGVYMHVVFLPESSSRNLVAVLDRCHVSVEMKVATPYAAALAIISDEEKDIGATVIDFGAGTTGFSTFLGGCLVNLNVVHAGGNAITRDVAQGLSCSLATAERLKTLNGAAFLSPRDEFERLIVPVLGDEEGTNIQMPRSNLISIVIPRVEDILEKVSLQLEENPRFLMASRRLILAGGGAGLQGIKEKTEEVLNATVRLGRPAILKGLPSQFDSYTFSTCIGLVKYAMMRQENILSSWHTSDGQKGQRNSRIRKVIQWLSQNF
ncbi:MAG: cell division protein FtsA [Alphaproteobacteria bacterium]|nr:cell division protein FtsA [Alphaproteobacteria bacterium]